MRWRTEAWQLVLTAVFTNFTQDHLDYHGDMQAYWQAKVALFKWPSLRAAVINRDDGKANELLAECEQSGVRTYTYSVREPADVWASDITLMRDGCRFTYPTEQPSTSHPGGGRLF